MGGSAVFAADVVTAVDSSSFVIQEQEFVGIFGRSLQAELHVVGGTAPYRWSLLASGLPDGVFFDQTTGRISGSPGRTGRFTFTVQATDVLQNSVSKVLTLDVRMADDPWLNQVDQTGVPQPVIIDLDHLAPGELEYLVDTFADDAPLIYVGPNAPEHILRINIAQMRIQPNGLYRVDGGTRSTVNENHKYSDVYYVDPDGRRHAFPTESTFTSWYKAEPKIEVVPDWKISNIPLRKNVTFRPGSIVRLENTSEFYRVLPHHTLKKFENETTYQRLSASTEIVPVLSLAQVADYQMDMNTIKTATDLMTMYPMPTQPVEEMGD